MVGLDGIGEAFILHVAAGTDALRKPDLVCCRSGLTSRKEHGRVVFGVARGYHTREVETLGGKMMSQEENRDLFEEQLELFAAEVM